MRKSISILAMCASFVTPALADGPTVLELYTSQGCSSCPPADAMLHDLADRDDVIPLALHVDYWDYIGWADVFAQASHTTRQQQYAEVAGHRTIYTPQMIIGGQDHVIGAKAIEVADTLAEHRNKPTGVKVEIRRAGDTLTIMGETSQALPEGVVVQVVRYNPSETVDVLRGENAGHVISYMNIVTSWDVVGEWSGGDDLAIDVAISGEEPVVVIVQEAGPGAVMATAVLR